MKIRTLTQVAILCAMVSFSHAQEITSENGINHFDPKTKVAKFVKRTYENYKDDEGKIEEEKSTEVARNIVKNSVSDKETKFELRELAFREVEDVCPIIKAAIEENRKLPKKKRQVTDKEIVVSVVMGAPEAWETIKECSEDLGVTGVEDEIKKQGELSFSDVSSSGSAGGFNVIGVTSGGGSFSSQCDSLGLSDDAITFLKGLGYTCAELSRISSSEIDDILCENNHPSCSKCSATGYSDEIVSSLIDLGYTCEELSRMSSAEIDEILCQNGHPACQNLLCKTLGLADDEIQLLRNAGYSCEQLSRMSSAEIDEILCQNGHPACQNLLCKTLGLADDEIQLLRNAGYSCEQLSRMSSAQIDSLLCQLGHPSCTSLVSETLTMEMILCLMDKGYTLAQISSAKANGTIGDLLTSSGCGNNTSPANSN